MEQLSPAQNWKHVFISFKGRRVRGKQSSAKWSGVRKDKMECHVFFSLKLLFSPHSLLSYVFVSIFGSLYPAFYDNVICFLRHLSFSFTNLFSITWVTYPILHFLSLSIHVLHLKSLRLSLLTLVSIASTPSSSPFPPLLQVLEFQGDGEASSWSWASPGWVSFPTPLAALTLCVHVLVPALRFTGTIFSLATNTTDNFFTVGQSTAR